MTSSQGTSLFVIDKTVICFPFVIVSFEYVAVGVTGVSAEYCPTTWVNPCPAVTVSSGGVAKPSTSPKLIVLPWCYVDPKAPYAPGDPVDRNDPSHRRVGHDPERGQRGERYLNRRDRSRLDEHIRGTRSGEPWHGRERQRVPTGRHLDPVQAPHARPFSVDVDRRRDRGTARDPQVPNEVGSRPGADGLDTNVPVTMRDSPAARVTCKGAGGS